MSTSNTSGTQGMALDLDLHFLPAWAQRSSTENTYSKYQGGEEPRERRGDRPGGRDRRDGGFQRREPRRDGPRPGGGPGAPQGQRREGGGRPPFRGGPRREEPREPLPPPIQIDVSLIPEAKGVEALARQIRLTGRAYPLFDIGFLVLKKPDRYDTRFSVIKGADGKAVQPLLLCGLDDSLWFSEQDAVNHVLDKHFATFYQSEKLPTDPPKGVYTFVAQCGMSGVILGPPNYHDYQNKLRKLHSERFSRMPFEAFKSRVKIVKDEAVVKQWIEEQSFRTEYTCLNVPETIKLNSRAEVEKHFRDTHLPVVIRQVESHTLAGPAAQTQPNRALTGLVRRAWEDQSRFPLKLVNTLSQQFAGHGLHFFKVNKNVTHVSVARPRYLDLETTTVSDGIRKLVEFIRNTAACTRRKIMDALVPSPAAAPAPQPAEGAAPAEAAPAAPAAEAPASPELAVLNADLHWLIHEGHLIEFANGTIELARKPAPKPPKPEPKPAAAGAPAAAASAETAAPAETAAAPEAPVAAAEPEAATTAVVEAAPTAEQPPVSDATPVPPAS